MPKRRAQGSLTDPHASDWEQILRYAEQLDWSWIEDNNYGSTPVTLTETEYNERKESEATAQGSERTV